MRVILVAVQVRLRMGQGQHKRFDALLVPSRDCSLIGKNEREPKDEDGKARVGAFGHARTFDNGDIRNPRGWADRITISSSLSPKSRVLAHLAAFCLSDSVTA
jgi:hypothetical protein